MELISKYKSQFVFYFILNVAFLLFITMTSYVHMPMVHINSYFVYGAHLLCFHFTLFWIIYLFTLNRWLFYCILLPLFFLLSIIAFFGFAYDISISVGVIQAALESKIDIIVDLITWQLLLYVLLIIGVIIVLVVLYNKVKVSKFNKLFVGLAVLSLFTLVSMETIRPKSFRNRYPITLYRELVLFLSKNPIKYEIVENKLNRSEETLQVIFVLGESVRADHLQINGYDRPTTPKLMQEANLISFPRTYTPYTYTSPSVTQILSNAVINDDYSQPKFSLINILHASGVATYWIGNQTPEKSYYPFISHAQTRIFIDPMRSLLSYHQMLDEALIPEMKKNYQGNTPQFILLHMIGSHWLYENRYSEEFRYFKPVAQSKYLPHNTQEQMLNSYDNTILYLDNFLFDIITYLKMKDGNVLLVYLSDHGEYLGENGKYLHAQPVMDDKVNAPGLVMWYSDKFKILHEDWIAQLKLNQEKLISTDFVFHTMLDIYGVNFDQYLMEKSLLKSFVPYSASDSLK